MRNNNILKTGPEFFKTRIYLVDSLILLGNIQTCNKYKLYSQDPESQVHQNFCFYFKTVYQKFRFLTIFLPESGKCWQIFLNILCLILYVTGWHERSPPDTPDSGQDPIASAVYQCSQSQAEHNPIFLHIPFHYVGRRPYCQNL